MRPGMLMGMFMMCIAPIWLDCGSKNAVGGTPASNLSGEWTLRNHADFVFDDYSFRLIDRNADENGDSVESKLAGPYEVRGDTVIWFYQNRIMTNLASGISETLTAQAKISNIDTFYMGINLNGPAVRVGGNQWESSAPMLNDSSLKIYGFGAVYPNFTNYTNIIGATGDTLSMLQSAFENSPPGDGIAFHIAVPSITRHYRVYLWFCRPDSITNKPVDFHFSVYGTNAYDPRPDVDTVMTNVGDWYRIGPYHVDDAPFLRIDAMTEAHGWGDVRRVSVSGIELCKGPSIREVNTFRYLYRIENDSLYLTPVQEKLFSSVALSRK